mgnify:CR=1 FL=1
MTSSLKKTLLTTLGIVLILLIWVIVSASISNSSMIFPNPLVTLKETLKLLGKSFTYKCIFQSLLKTFLGFLLSFVFAMLLGVIAGNIEEFRTILSPLLSVLKSIPTATLVFLFLVLVGAKNAPIIMVFIICFPIIYEAVVRGFENIDINIKRAAVMDGANLSQKLFKIYIPIISPYIIVGIASSFSLSFKIEIMSEVISGTTTDGLGSMISACQKSDPTNMTPIFAYSLIGIVIIAIFSLALYFLERKVITSTSPNI